VMKNRVEPFSHLSLNEVADGSLTRGWCDGGSEKEFGKEELLRSLPHEHKRL